ncbi:MAG: TetR/AcrR family transcriptional regulator [Rothia sp. (in: high G+C Gram-positive bacteria)]|nr:TetR/AcrR family transcriptional regulator [Rothia sp. (in: high G+C Gram-positive bacteria)]
MPKLINHLERKQEIAHAVWAVLKRDGVRGVSIRTVAAEAGVSTGSLRHVFPSLDEMMLFSLDYAGKSFLRSITDRQIAGTLFDNLEEIFVRFAPITDEGTLFAEVAAGVLAEVAAFPGSIEILQQQEVDFTYAYGFVLSQMRAHDMLRPDVDIELEAGTLVTLLLGINVFYLLSNGSVSAQDLQVPLQTHVQSLLLAS